VKRGFSQDGFASQERFRNSFCNLERPGVVEVVAIPKRNDKSCVRDSLHRREKPFREERLTGPLIFPASLRNR
jgi:hypothetical protein